MRTEREFANCERLKRGCFVVLHRRSPSGSPQRRTRDAACALRALATANTPPEWSEITPLPPPLPSSWCIVANDARPSGRLFVCLYHTRTVRNNVVASMMDSQKSKGYADNHRHKFLCSIRGATNCISNKKHACCNCLGHFVSEGRDAMAISYFQYSTTLRSQTNNVLRILNT